MRVLAVLPPDADADTPLWILSVSPTAMKSFDGYVADVARRLQVPPVGVVTEIWFDPESDYASLRFGNPRQNDDIGTFYARKEEAQKRLAQEPDVSAYEAPKPVKKAVTRR